MKIIKKIIQHCNGNCEYFNFSRPDIKTIGFFNCTNPKVRRKNGNYRRISRKILITLGFPSWCQLEDYKKEIN